MNRNNIVGGLNQCLQKKHKQTHTKYPQLHELTPNFFFKRLPLKTICVEWGLNFSYKINIKRSFLCIIICIPCIYMYVYL